MDGFYAGTIEPALDTDQHKITLNANQGAVFLALAALYSPLPAYAIAQNLEILWPRYETLL
ncbi:MAG: hypothetical protein H0U72_05695 [Nitrosospira sp.]|nr:hypothetical protein [Nitrosospira sp.]